MPIISLDFAKIKSGYGLTNTALYFLTDAQATILLSLSEQLTWDKTWQVNGQEYNDEIQTEVADLQRYLMSPVYISDLIGYIDEIEDLLRALQTIGVTGCCDGLGPLTESYDSPNVDNYPGTPPATWGDGEPIADSDDWKDLVCGAAHSYVDLLKETGSELEKLITAGGVVIGAIAAILALLSGAGILLVIAYGTAATITTALIAGAAEGLFGGTVDDLEAAREDIVCAIVNGSAEDLSDAIENTVDALAWTLWFQHIDYLSAYNTMIDGKNGNGTLEVNRGLDCPCDGAEYAITYDFTPGWEGWANTALVYYQSTIGNPLPSIGIGYNATSPGLHSTIGTHFDKAGVPGWDSNDKMVLHSWNWQCRYNNPGASPITLRAYIMDDSGPTFQDFVIPDGVTWLDKEMIFDPPLEITGVTTSDFRFFIYAYVNAGRVDIDNIQLNFDFVPIA